MTKQKQKIKNQLVWEKLTKNITKKKQHTKHVRLAKKIEKTRIKKKRVKVFACKRCFVKFFNNIKLHQYVQNHYQKKLIFSAFNEIVLFAMFSQKFSTSSFISLSISSKIAIKFILSILFIFVEHILFATLFATSKILIFWAKIASKLMISLKLSRLSRFVFKIQSTSTLLLFTRFYITMNNLFVMFVERSKLLNLSHRQKNSFFSYNKQFNKFVICYQTRITSYFLSSLNSFKFNILSKLDFCLSIQASVLRRHISFCEQIIDFVSQSASIFNHFYCISYICRRCKQILIFENQLHKHFRHCKKRFKCQIFARNFIVVWRKL